VNEAYLWLKNQMAIGKVNWRRGWSIFLAFDNVRERLERDKIVYTKKMAEFGFVHGVTHHQLTTQLTSGL